MNVKNPYSVAPLSFIAGLDLSFFCSQAMAQGFFEGAGEVDDGSSSCVGDGCNIEIPDAGEGSSSIDGEVTPNAPEGAAVTEGEQPRDSTAKVAHMDDEEDTRDYFTSESHSDYQARKEGFSRRIQFGARISGGTNVAFGDNDGWNPGVEVEGGIFARLPLTSSGLSVVSGLEFGYRRYSYEGDTEYSKNEATLSQMVFDIPILLQYAFDEDGLFFGFGSNIQLKMQGESKFTQAIDTDKVHTKGTLHNTLPTSGVEIGLTADIGYSLASWCQVDIRGTFNFTNLLDQDVIAESTLMGATLHVLHLNAGLTFLL